MIFSARLAPIRGAYRDRHGRRARDAMDVLRPQDERRAMRTAKSRGPGAPTLASSLVEWRCRPFGIDTPWSARRRRL